MDVRRKLVPRNRNEKIIPIEVQVVPARRTGTVGYVGTHSEVMSGNYHSSSSKIRTESKQKSTSSYNSYTDTSTTLLLLGIMD